MCAMKRNADQTRCASLDSPPKHRSTLRKPFLDHTIPDGVYFSIFTRMLYTLGLYLITGTLFAIYMYLLFYFTIMADYPRLTGKSSPLQMNPGLSVVPNPNWQTSLVHIRLSDPVSFVSMVDELTAFLMHYQPAILGGMMADCERNPTYVNMRRPCRFPLDTAGPCNLRNGFGYARSQPCFVVKLNRIYGWLPDPLANISGVGIKCGGLTEFDSQLLGPVCYHDLQQWKEDRARLESNTLRPSNCSDRQYGVLNSIYYPFLNQAKYHSPLVFIQLLRPRRNVIIWVKCIALAKNIHIDWNRNEGSTVFQVMID